LVDEINIVGAQCAIEVLERLALAGRKGLRHVGRHACDSHPVYSDIQRLGYETRDAIIEINADDVSSSMSWITLVST
jgi:hypothetical protein